MIFFSQDLASVKSKFAAQDGLESLTATMNVSQSAKTAALTATAQPPMSALVKEATLGIISKIVSQLVPLDA